MAHDVIGLLHPKSSWYKDNQDLIGQEIVVNEITPCHTLPNWFYGNITLINPKNNTYECLGNKLNIHGFRPRRVLK